MREEQAVFVGGTLLAAQNGEHREIEKGSRGFRLQRVQHLLDQQEFAVCGHGPSAIPENGERGFVGPVMDNLRQQVGIGRARNHIEEGCGRLQSHAGDQTEYRAPQGLL
jgi:hypothetical protein